MCPCKKAADKFMIKFKKFTIFDIGIFKTSLISAGMIIGILCGKKFKGILPIAWVSFIGANIYLIYKLFVESEMENAEKLSEFDDFQDYNGYEN